MVICAFHPEGENNIIKWNDLKASGEYNDVPVKFNCLTSRNSWYNLITSEKSKSQALI